MKNTAIALENSLSFITKHMPPDAIDWWVIGSAAIAISTDIDIVPKDVDIVANTKSIKAFLQNAGEPLAQSVAHPLFKSFPFQRIAVENGIAVEVMGDLKLKDKTHGWQPLCIRTRQTVMFGKTTVYVPAIEEQIEILKRFGRSKDLEKVKLINAR
ncbi:hypothetical protein [Ahrensia marina]|uniref:Uncharacterized protein n=1 Tax=Ahrensia marina TaxID=1514904 RepID=A0A0M9GL23_9HYPH|nr:hypothetical protein [Ahrensia marina]KPB00297.1 hypothetical protein SU32_14355 [Ahrensia marina]